jgi:hypothetical protein
VLPEARGRELGLSTSLDKNPRYSSLGPSNQQAFILIAGSIAMRDNQVISKGPSR